MNVSAGGAEDRTWREPRDDVVQVGSKVRSLHSSYEVCCWSSAGVLDPTLGRTVHAVSPVISVLCHSDRHVLMLSIQAVRAPGIVPCIISFSTQLPCLLMM